VSAALKTRKATEEGLTRRELELAGILAAYNDVTERLKSAHERLEREVVRLREELREKNEELQRRQRLAALGEMAAGLAHEIRNPLGGIALYASHLERELAGQPSAQTAGKIFHGVRSLERLVGEILDFAQEDRIEPRCFPILTLLRSVEEHVSRAAEEHGVTLCIELDPASGAEAWGDMSRLERVLTNLALNAIEASGLGGHARLAARVDAEGTCFEVTDTGPGIPEDLRQRIFHPFFTTKADGTGLGLAICHRIVEAHHGSIRTSNQPSGGARFTVRLPPGPGTNMTGAKEAF
jgi:two-component system sensor histidine kinase HydH